MSLCKLRQCMRQVSSNTLQQVETFNYLLGIIYLYRSVATKRELSNTAKLSDQGWTNSGPRNVWSATAFSVARGSIQEILQI